MNESRMHATGLKKLMEAQGRQTRWLANEVKLSESFTGRVIRGERTVSHEKAKEIATVIGVPLFLLFEFTTVSKRGTVKEAIAS